MDPDTTLLWLLEGIAANDCDKVCTALDDLRVWIENGGFLPDVRKVADQFITDQRWVK
jgi:hypothetical protein